MTSKTVTVTKVGAEEPKKAVRKTQKTFPRGIMKKTSKFTIKGTSDPAKAPPLKKGMRKHTLRMLTEKGMKKHRKTLKRKISNMNDSKVREVVHGKGLVLNNNTPPAISRQILHHAASAGFVSI
jgi:tyrosyl-tRNA synthetase